MSWMTPSTVSDASQRIARMRSLWRWARRLGRLVAWIFPQASTSSLTLNPTTRNTTTAFASLARFLKMVRMGVPEQAVKNKMALEGFDPDLLDTPEATLLRADAA